MSKIIDEIIEVAREENRTFLLEPESKKLIQELEIPTTNFYVGTTVDQAKKIAEELGFPVVMKIISPQVVHKTDAGGVKLNLQTVEEVERAYNEMMEQINKEVPNADIRGVLIEKMAEPSTEIIIGVTRDPTFGPAIMFGLGGIFVELFKDVSFRIAPITTQDAQDMIHEIKALPMLRGFRGGPKVNLSLIVDVLKKVSKLSMDYQEDILEIDLNPIFAYEDKLLTVDARVILTKKD